MSTSPTEKVDVSKVVGEVAITVEELYPRGLPISSGAIVATKDKSFICINGAL